MTEHTDWPTSQAQRDNLARLNEGCRYCDGSHTSDDHDFSEALDAQARSFMSAYWRNGGISTDRPVPQQISGCTCGGIDTTGAHSQGCIWR